MFLFCLFIIILNLIAQIEFQNMKPTETPAPTQFNIKNWETLSIHCNNEQLREKVLNGLKHGFEIRRHGPFPTKCQRNLPTDDIGKLHITKWIIDGCTQGHFLGPFKKPPYKKYHVSPVGTVNKRQTIHHLSAHLEMESQSIHLYCKQTKLYHSYNSNKS